MQKWVLWRSLTTRYLLILAYDSAYQLHMTQKEQPAPCSGCRLYIYFQ